MHLADLRLAVRGLVRRPAFTAAVVVTLALGLGANAAIFSFVDTVLIKRLPFDEPERLVQVWERQAGSAEDNVVSPANFADWAAAAHGFEHLAGYWRNVAPLRGMEAPEEVQVTIASTCFFDVFGVQAEVGRLFGPEDVQPGQFAGDFAVLSHSFWQRRFGGSPDVVGSTITVWTSPVTVVGVAPPELELVDPASEIFLPTTFEWADRTSSGRFIKAAGRLAPGVSRETAQAEMSAIAARLAQEYPDFDTGWGVYLKPLSDELVGAVRPALLLLLGAVGLLLLVAAANVANLLLARAADREQEIALRTALGAPTWRVAGQMLAESLVLVSAAGALGAGFAVAATELLKATVLSEIVIPRLDEVAVDGKVLGFLALLVLVTGVVFSLVPALSTRSLDLAGSLKEGGREIGGRHRRRVQKGLVVAEVALAAMLVVGAGLLLRSFAELGRVDPGIDVDGVLTARVLLSGGSYREAAGRIAFYRQAQERLEAVPGIRKASAIQWLPLSGRTSATTFYPEDRPRPEVGSEPVTGVRAVLPGYFETVGMRLEEGRTFDGRDTEDSTPVVVVNRAMVRDHWNGESPIGKSLAYNWGDWVSVTVVGVVSDVRHQGLRVEPSPAIFRPYSQAPYGSLNLVMRTEVAPSALTGAVAAAIREIDPTLPVSQFRTLAEYRADAFAEPRLYTALMSGFSVLALVLAAVGVYALISYAVARRTREIGVRMTLGAGARDVVALVLRYGLGLAALGLAVGLVAAAALSRLLESLLFGVQATDPATFLAVPLVLVAATVIACLVPARRASRVDPTVALRYE